MRQCDSFFCYILRAWSKLSWEVAFPCNFILLRSKLDYCWSACRSPPVKGMLTTSPLCLWMSRVPTFTLRCFILHYKERYLLQTGTDKWYLYNIETLLSLANTFESWIFHSGVRFVHSFWAVLFLIKYLHFAFYLRLQRKKYSISFFPIIIFN